MYWRLLKDFLEIELRFFNFRHVLYTLSIIAIKILLVLSYIIYIVVLFFYDTLIFFLPFDCLSKILIYFLIELIVHVHNWLSMIRRIILTQRWLVIKEALFIVLVEIKIPLSTWDINLATWFVVFKVICWGLFREIFNWGSLKNRVQGEGERWPGGWVG